MRNAELSKRANQRRSGRVPLSFQEAWYKRGGSNYNSSNTGSTNKVVQTFDSGDYTGAGPYTIEFDHNLGTEDYSFHVFKTDNNAPIIVEYFHQGEDTLTLEFTGNTLPIKVIIFY
jgi:hypothetical protein